MTIVLEIYIVVCVALLLFDIGFLAIKNSKNKYLKSEDKAFYKLLKQESENYRTEGKFSENFEKDLPKQLSKTKHLITLHKLFEDEPDTQSFFRQVLFSLIDTYRKHNDYEQAFYTYIISELDYSKEKVLPSFSCEFIDFLESKSLYTFSNAMDAFYAFGDDALLLQALDVVDRRNGFYHDKLLTDGLLSYKGDHNRLKQEFIQRFFRYGEQLQVCLLDYFRLYGSDVSELCLKLMKEEKAYDEVQYRAMRYFQKFPCDEAKEWFVNILERDDVVWIKQMLAIQGLHKYDDAVVYDVVKNKLTSREWHVRNNAAEFFYKKGLSKEELMELLSFKDKYANESLLYQYRDNEEMTIFIKDVISLQNEENAS